MNSSVFQNKAFFNASLIVVVVLAVILRFWQLGAVPAGLTWDEAAIGYNGYSVITTRRDEWLELLPLSFKSFGDYKAPLAIYVTGVFVYLLGIAPWVIRLPFAISGVLSVLLLMLLTWQLYEKSRWRKVLTIASGLFLALSPWHILFSRAGFESGMAVCLVLGGLVLLRYGKKLLTASDIKLRKSQIVLGLSGLFFALSLYAYHSAKISVPLLLLFLSIWSIPYVKNIWKTFIWLPVVFLIVISPLVYSHVFGEAATRASVLIFSSNLSTLEMLTTVSTNLFRYFSPSFLLFGETNTLRHGTGMYGVLTPVTALLAFIGLIVLSWKKVKLENTFSKESVLAVVITVVGILPASLVTAAEPHPNRSLLAVIGFILLAVVGLRIVLTYISQYKKLATRIFLPILIAIFLFVEVLYAGLFSNYYFTEYNKTIGTEYFAGYLEVMHLAEEYLSGNMPDGKPEVVLVSSKHGQPYIFALLAKKASPYAFHWGTLQKYLFIDEVTSGDLNRENALIIATSEELSTNLEPVYEVVGDDDTNIFTVYLSENVTDENQDK